MSRVPPLKLPRKIVERMASMPPAVSGRILSWGWRCYQGETIFLDEEEAKDSETRSAIAHAVDLFDSTALALNIIDVEAFTNARHKDIAISAKRARAREKRFEIEQEREETNVVPMRKYADGSYAEGQGTKGDHPSSNTPECRVATAHLVTLGISNVRAASLADRFIKEFGADAVLTITEKMKGRRVASPERYLSRALSNYRDDALPQKQQASPHVPRAVRRQIPARKDGAWELLGWTCRDHPRSTNGQKGRLKVWRSDSGRLVYKPYEENETPPTFEEDAGIMEVE